MEWEREREMHQQSPRALCDGRQGGVVASVTGIATMDR
jgi:hypothetical protein